MNWLEIKNLEVWIGNQVLYKNLNLTLRLGENTVLIGPNGSGKSTIINLINRTIYPVIKKGSYFKLFGDKDINIWNMRSNIGFVNKDIESRMDNNARALNIVLSGYYGKLYIDEKEINISKEKKDQALNLMKDLKIDNIYMQKYKNLSDGQKRKLMIARALVHKPKILVLDEPTINLDIGSRYSLVKILDQLNKAGTTILQVTHEIDSIMRSAKRVLFIKDFQIVQDGRPTEIFTGKNISDLFDTPLEVLNKNGFWQIIPK